MQGNNVLAVENGVGGERTREFEGFCESTHDTFLVSLS